MIRFFDKEAKSINLKDYDRDLLLTYFLREKNLGQDDDIVLVYDKENYYGFVTYESVLYKNGNDGIILEKYIVGESDNVYEFSDRSNQFKDIIADLYDIFEHKIEYASCIPILDVDRQLSYFAYQYTSQEIEFLEKCMLRLFEQSKDALFIKELYPEIEKVCIYDFNELAFRFYRILKERNFNVEVFGEKWRILCPDIYENDQIKFGYVLNEKIMNIYAEGASSIKSKKKWKQMADIQSAWYFLNRMGYVNAVQEMKKIKKDLCEKNIPVLIMIFPDFGELNGITVDEFYRHSLNVNIENQRLDIKNSIIIEQIKKCWKKNGGGQNRVEKAISSIRKRHRSQSMIIGDISLEKKVFGSGKHTLYLIGPCIAAGAGVDEEDSLGAYLHQQMQKYKKDYMVECIAEAVSDFSILKNIIETLDLYDGDIVIFISSNKAWNSDMCKEMRVSASDGDIDVKEIINGRQDDWFWNIPIHTNQQGNAEIAKGMMEKYLLKLLKDDELQNGAPHLLKKGELLLPRKLEDEIVQYINKIKAIGIKAEKIGCVVMNCNPMTKGHEYLIQCALQQVDFLYIFVVEEDKSEILFSDRISIVRAVTEKYHNLKVIPSGRFIVSSETLPLYFEKKQRQEEVLDATWDLRIFGEKVAPLLGIKVRFVGEEPNDKITNQYNKMMKKILPASGIQLVEIPRLKLENQVVSAAMVRRCMCRGEMNEVRQFVPGEAYNRLLELRIDLCKRT